MCIRYRMCIEFFNMCTRDASLLFRFCNHDTIYKEPASSLRSRKAPHYLYVVFYDPRPSPVRIVRVTRTRHTVDEPSDTASTAFSIDCCIHVLMRSVVFHMNCAHRSTSVPPEQAPGREDIYTGVSVCLAFNVISFSLFMYFDIIFLLTPP